MPETGHLPASFPPFASREGRDGWRVVWVIVNFVNFTTKLASAAGLAYLSATKEKVRP